MVDGSTASGRLGSRLEAVSKPRIANAITIAIASRCQEYDEIERFAQLEREFLGGKTRDCSAA